MDSYKCKQPYVHQLHDVIANCSYKKMHSKDILISPYINVVKLA